MISRNYCIKLFLIDKLFNIFREINTINIAVIVVALQGEKDTLLSSLRQFNPVFKRDNIILLPVKDKNRFFKCPEYGDIVKIVFYQKSRRQVSPCELPGICKG